METKRGEKQKTTILVLTSVILLIMAFFSVALYYWCLLSELILPIDSSVCSICLFEDQSLCFNTKFTNYLKIFGICLSPSIISIIFGSISHVQTTTNNHKYQKLTKMVVVLSVILLFIGVGFYFLLAFGIYWGQ